MNYILGENIWLIDMKNNRKISQINKEIFQTYMAIVVTIITSLGLLLYLFNGIANKIIKIKYYETFTQAIFILILLFFFYGTLAYFICRLGYWKRKINFCKIGQEELDNFSSNSNLPRVSYLIPSYKEDTRIIKQTLFSAALQEYPNKKIVLLIDNPPNPQDIDDINLLIATRQAPKEIQDLLTPIFKKINKKYNNFLKKKEEDNFDIIKEIEIITDLLQSIAIWFKEQADHYQPQDHTEDLMLEKVFIAQYKYMLNIYYSLKNEEELNLINSAKIKIIYQKLVSIFQVELSSFERKRYHNLSHKSNKAMNLNTYISLMGETFNQIETEEGLHLVNDQNGNLVISDADYIIILDADSIILPEYTKTLAYLMEQAEGEKFAVAQTPYSAYPNPSSFLERIASATTDVQRFMHQGSTLYHATYWIGANAMVRKKALHSIMTTRKERGFNTNVYIQDETVIEDTESTIDLITKGWQLYSYLDTLSYSATPPDFGSLGIQRQRWANGGLIILPKLLKFLISRPKKAQVFYQGFLRIYYLTSSIFYLAILILLLYPLGQEKIVILSASFILFIPYYYLYMRDLQYMNYKKTDLMGIFALNLILLPVNISGLLQSVRQILTGKHTEFRRTPKVKYITQAPLFFILVDYGFCLYSAIAFLRSVYSKEWVNAAYNLINFCFWLYGIKALIKYYPTTLLKDISKYLNNKGQSPRL